VDVQEARHDALELPVRCGRAAVAWRARRLGSTLSAMSEETRTYPEGVPCWIDTDQPDPEAAVEFYGQLFGWTFRDEGAVPGAYQVATIDTREVAAIRFEASGPVAWNTYIAVDDAEAAVARVTEFGGEVASPPEDLVTDGRRATCVDPLGTPFRLWEAGAISGAQLVNAPGAWNFSHLHCADAPAAREFYERVFGWEALELGPEAVMWRRPGYGDHLEATVDPGIRARQADVKAPPGFEDVIAGLDRPSTGETAPRWHVVFAVPDRDAAAATAKRLGATIVSSRDTGWTREAAVRDPAGAEFTLSQFTPPSG